MKQLIQQTLRGLGITGNYRGYQQLSIALQIVIENEEGSLNITRDVYKPTAEILHCNYETVERNIRTVIYRAWKRYRKEYEAIAALKLDRMPTVSEFIDTLANHIRCQCTANIEK